MPQKPQRGPPKAKSRAKKRADSTGTVLQSGMLVLAVGAVLAGVAILNLGDGGPDSVDVKVVANGASESSGAVHRTLTRADLVDTTFYTFDSGEKIESLSQIQNRQNTTVVGVRNGRFGQAKGPRLETFVWPSMPAGTQVEVPDVVVAGAPVILESLAATPKIFYIHNFFTEAEAEQLIAMATSDGNPHRMKRSTVMEKGVGAHSSTGSTRTSHSAYDLASPAARALKRRAFQLLRIPYHEGLADGVQIVRYETNQAYIPHHDYYPVGQTNDHNWDPRTTGGSNRFATVFLYLSDGFTGGSTVFPRAANITASSKFSRPSETHRDEFQTLADSIFPKQSWERQMVTACAAEYGIKAEKGGAILFYSQRADGALDELSQHGGCPVLEGTKWAANVWVWNDLRHGWPRGRA